MSNLENNLAYIRTVGPQNLSELGPRLYETLRSLIQQNTNLQMQVNGNTNGEPAAPPTINGLQVTAQNGHFNVAITDNNQIYRGIKYFVEHADNPNFTNPTRTQASGTELRNHNEYLGNVTRYWRAYSAYASSAPSAPVYHGGAQPIAVSGNDANNGGPKFLPDQGTGTGAAGEGLQGPGRIPYRTLTGAPPVRGQS